GAPIAAEIYMFGGSSMAMLEVDDPATSGSDQALMDDMLISLCNPTDVCIWIDYLTIGDYEVLTYALTPGEPGRSSPVRVDFGSPGPTPVGGSWPGNHVELVSYARHTVAVGDNGRMALHSGTPGGNLQAGINGIQIRHLDAVGVEPGLGAASSSLRRIVPNPASGTQRIEMRLAEASAGAALEIVDIAGRIMWRAAIGHLGAGNQVLEWNGRDDAGRPAPAGLYFARITGGATSGGTLKLVRVD
ncbi:MAG TPA: FlgD immunoglobulin-like domain containing protein, partial [Candidatus Limnocylindria bacterium]|nr:FlgD immunoglobulin-like domain containing protein [Candidatus Limnocylindria bacterium]